MLTRDLKMALRVLHTRLSFSVLAVAMLALGVAGNAAIFSIFNGLFLRPLPFEAADRLVDLDETAPRWNLRYVGVSHPDFAAWRKDNQTFDSMAFFGGASMNLAGDDRPQRIQGANVTRDLLDVLKLKLVVGRNFLDEEDRPGGARVVLLGYELWQRRFAGDPEAVGKILQLDGRPHTIVGVLPREAVFPSKAQLWVPLAADPQEGGSWYLSGVGRLKDGVTLEQAGADLLRVHRGLAKAGRSENEITSPVITPLRERYLGDYRNVARILMAAVALVLLIACANIAGLMLVRATARAREVAVRMALGASRAVIVRQLLLESAVLATLGGALGVLLGNVGLRAMLTLIPDDLPRWIRFDLDFRFLVFCLGITALAAVLFGLAPALEASRVDLRASLHETGTRSTISAGRRRSLSALVVGEVALALVLLASAGLLVRAFQRVLEVDPGFRPQNVLSYWVVLPPVKYDQPEKRLAFFDELLRQTRALPGVVSAGAANPPPLGGHSGTFFVAEGAPPLRENEQNPVVLRVSATPGYFDAIGLTLLAGRQFDERDGTSGQPPVAIINESFARRFFPQGDSVGKRIRYSSSKADWMEVIGLARDQKHYGLDQEMRPAVYVPYRHMTNDGMAVVLRGTGTPEALAAPARQVLERLDPELPIFEVRAMTETVDRSLWVRRTYSWLFGAFAAVALVMAAAGMYSVISYAVSRRTHEIGIRLTLGARPGQVLRQVLVQGMTLALAGLTIGLAAMWWAGPLLQTLLFGVSPRDLWTYGVVAGGLAIVALLANLVPARQAAAVDPMHALRSE